MPEVLDVDDVVNLLPAKLVQQKHLERKLCNLEEFYSFPYDYLKPVQQLFVWVKHSIQEASADIAVNFQLTQASEDMWGSLGDNFRRNWNHWNLTSILL